MTSTFSGLLDFPRKRFCYLSLVTWLPGLEELSGSFDSAPVSTTHQKELVAVTMDIQAHKSMMLVPLKEIFLNLKSMLDLGPVWCGSVD